MSVEQIKEALDEADQDPMVILKHNEWPYELAELKESDGFDDRNKYLEVVDHINWRSVSMRREDFESQIDAAGRKINRNDSAEIHELSPSEFRNKFNWGELPDRRMAYLCHQWCKENAHIAFSNDQVFVYDEGIWVNEPRRVAHTLQKLLGEYYGKHVKEEFIDGYVAVNEAYRVDWDDMGLKGPRCVVNNGILNLVKGELERPVRPEDYAIIKFPVTWEGSDAKCPTWEGDFLKQSVTSDDRTALQEYAGYCLHTNDYAFKKALMMLGDGNNGKGVFEDVLTAVIGPDNVMNYDLHELSGANFGLQRLQNSAVNINSDIEGNEIKHTSTFKKLTGRDRFKVEPKYETPFEIENSAKLLFAANRIPDVDTDDLAFFARWIFVEFPHRFTTKSNDGYFDADPYLADEIIEEELPGVLAWMVEGYQRLVQQEYFSSEMSPEEVREEWNHLSDPTVTFIRNFVKAGHPVEDGDKYLNARMAVYELYDLYEDFMKTTPVSPTSKQKLSVYIKNRFKAETVPERRKSGDGEVVRVWDGVYIPASAQDEIRALTLEAIA